MIVWTEKHKLEAISFVYNVARKLALTGGDYRRAGEAAPGAGVSEHVFRVTLSYLEGFGSNKAIDSAVRRVDSLATGRLVRDEVWCLRKPLLDEYDQDYGEVGDGEMKARMIRDQCPERRLIRVTRIRRRLA